MIEILIDKRKICMNGHAGKNINGQDIVCAAISALTCSLINSLQDLTDVNICADTGPGMTTIKWDQLTDDARLLIDSWFLGIAAINREYNCIKFI